MMNEEMIAKAKEAKSVEDFSGIDVPAASACRAFPLIARTRGCDLGFTFWAGL